ncbi:MAG: PQQ-binding-like beta-propeller repeat protein [Candidatus Bathyarchaeia archaeon]
MKMLKNKIFAITIAFFFILSMTASIVLTPNANATTLAPGKIDIPTYAFCNVGPNPAGVGQEVNVGFWLGEPPPTASGPYGDRWMGLMVKVTLPDGSNQTLGSFTTDDTGGTHTDFTPTAAGNYTFQMSFPGQVLAGSNPIPGQSAIATSYVGDYFEPSISNTYTLTVQQNMLPAISENPLPTNYWTRPIESVNDLWYTISGNWLGFGNLFSASGGMYNDTGNYNPYTTAPTTAHILWTKPLAFGGLVGGEFGGTDTSNYYSTRQYERMFSPIIIQGILYYTEYPESLNNPTGFAAVNLQTGQTIWTSNSPLELPATTDALGNGTTLTLSTVSSQGPCTVLRCGQLLDYVTPNQFGSLAYLWSTGTPAFVASATNIAAGSTTYNMFDAMTGDFILSIVNGTAMTLTEDANGDLIGYYVNSTNANAPTLNEWNSSKCIPQQAAFWEWRPPQGAILPFNAGIEWTVPIPTSLNGVAFPSGLALSSGTYSTTSISINSGVVPLVALGGPTGISGFNSGYIIEAGYSETTGQQLWIVNRTETPFTRVDFSQVGDGVYVEANQETGICIGYSITTGKQLWGPVTLPNYDPYNSIGGLYGQVANNVLYMSTFGGNIYAMNLQTGAFLWQTNTNNLSGLAGSNSPYGVWPLWQFGDPGAIADGMLFLDEGHEYSPPLFRGASEIAINITNGQLAWSIMGFDVDGGTAVSDGIMVAESAYDNQLYAFGMGPSATTITSPDIGVTTSTPITITGTVLDTSAGSQQNAVAANFPYGLPCVSDVSMTQFMESVYEQQPMPTNTTGVPVTISVLDSNGNNRVIGTTTTNSQGVYSFTWKPDISGNYTIYATFAGTQSYYGSSASTGFYASSSAPTAAPTATQLTGLASNATLMYGLVAIIIVIIVIGAVIMLMLSRKRP